MWDAPSADIGVGSFLEAFSWRSDRSRPRCGRSVTMGDKGFTALGILKAMNEWLFAKEKLMMRGHSPQAGPSGDPFFLHSDILR